MLSPSHRRLRDWSAVHRWTSLVSTAFLLMLCITGLPLIFADEIRAWAEGTHALALDSADAPQLRLDEIVAIARRERPREVIRVVEPSDPSTVAVFMGRTPDPGPDGRLLRIDRHSGAILDTPTAPSSRVGKALQLVDDLHSELLLGDWGEWILLAIGILFIVAIASGVVLYGPFTRKLDFGEVRPFRSKRTYWLDLHNLLGIAALAWMLVVGATGALNTMSGLMLQRWQSGVMPRLTVNYKGNAVVADPSSLDRALSTAQRAVPGMTIGVIIFPNRNWGSPNHYFMLASGKSALTSRLRTTILVDAKTGKLTSVEPFPWYLRAIEVSRPLHFGDYGGLPLKILWALLDVITIAVLGSGLYLWIARPRRERAAARPEGLHGASPVMEPAE